MSEKTLNFLINLSLVITVGSFLTFTGNLIQDPVVIEYIKYVFMVGFGFTPLLLMLKIISRLFLSGFKGQSTSFIEGAFTFYRFLLTKEAKKEWADYIEEQKRKSIQS